jgi:hypothetical protein
VANGQWWPDVNVLAAVGDVMKPVFSVIPAIACVPAAAVVLVLVLPLPLFWYCHCPCSGIATALVLVLPLPFNAIFLHGSLPTAIFKIV